MNGLAIIFFYINTENTNDCFDKINQYINYFKENPNEVLQKIDNCRQIFMKNFKLDLQLENLINNIENNIENEKNKINLSE